ncbi:hypothetical protein JX266_002267 [Neoarthrinium moseri]|nr:hypothetical protein JX266_002267 [Neoarthrinium moseri]
MGHDTSAWWHGIESTPMLGLAILGFVAIGLLVAFLAPRQLPSRIRTLYQAVDEKPEAYPNASVFPPSRRAALEKLLPRFQIVKKENVVPVADLKRNQLTTKGTQDLNRKDQFTPTGILTQEIKALGKFPDYSVLSGVPHPKPIPSFDISKAVFRPFRPFRWNYHQTMSLMKMESDYWIELEHNYFTRMKQRIDIWEQHGERIMFEAPGSELASRELMEMVLQNICIKYPHYFQLEENNTILRNRLLDTSIVIGSMPALEVLYRTIPEDFAVMCRNEEDGMYYLRSAMVCSSVGWNIGLHKNKILRKIHDAVPQWEEKMAFSVDRWFTKLPTDAPVQRGSWGIEDWEAFFCPEDHPRSAFHDNASACKVEDLQLRCDWQTLRRLPISGAVVFNFKAVFTPLVELAKEPYVPALLHRVITQGQRELISYKMEPHVKQVAEEALERWAKKQEEDGVTEAGWQVGTLEESPFFPGWQESADFGGCPCR